MCEPVSTTTMFYTSLAMSAAQAGMQYMAQSAQANSQAEYQNRQAAANAEYMKQNAEAANKAYIEEAAQQNQQLVEKEIRTSQEIQEVQREALQKTGQLVANSEGSGLTYDLLMGDFFRQEAGYRDSARHQMELDSNQAQMNIKGFRAKAESRGNSVRPYIPEPIQQPSLMGTALQIGGSAISAYGKYSTKGADGKYRLS